MAEEQATAALPPLATSTEAEMEAADAADTAAAAALAGQPAEWAFPVYVGHRRRVRPDDVLFEAGNDEREELGKQAVRSVAREEPKQLAKESQLANRDLASYLAHKYECATCHASLPTSHLLSCHISELHDSYFAAQAARRMRVYCCLVEGCGRKFCTPQERKQHLVGHHRFPRNYAFDRIHLRRRHAQIRPLPEYQKPAPPAILPPDEVVVVEAAGPGPAVAAQLLGECGAEQHSAPADHSGADALPGAAAGQQAGAAGHDEEMAEGLSRLSMAAQDPSVPGTVVFGRRGAVRTGMIRGRGSKPGVRSGS